MCLDGALGGKVAKQNSLPRTGLKPPGPPLAVVQENAEDERRREESRRRLNRRLRGAGSVLDRGAPLGTASLLGDSATGAPSPPSLLGR